MPEDLSYDASQGVDAFLRRMAQSLSTAPISANLTDTRATRMTRRYSIKEVCAFLNMSRNAFDRFVRNYDVPKGQTRGREVVYTADDIMRMRVLNSARRDAKNQPETIFWRRPGDVLPVITVGSQKGGSGKSITSANLATYASTHLGLRVGIIDADPQGTASLYFADDKVDICSIDTRTFTNFMGMVGEGDEESEFAIIKRDAAELDTFWKPTSWPGLRLLPGGPSIQAAEFLLQRHLRNPNPNIAPIFELLKDALQRHDEGHPPIMSPSDIVGPDGKIIEERYHEALTEAFDLIIIDCQPALSLAMLTTIVAGTSLVVPTPLRGFDINTTRAYGTSASDMIDMLIEEHGLRFPKAPSFILPTVVSFQTGTDLLILSRLMEHDASLICPVFYKRSEAVANAAEFYQSLYEYTPPKGKKKSTEDFLSNANAVGDAIISKCIPRIKTRGFANEFIQELYKGNVPNWVEED